MARYKVIANVAELGILTGFARTRRRLITWVIIFNCLMFLHANLSAWWMREYSDSIVLNMFIITSWMVMVIITSYLGAMLVGDLFFEPGWRERVLLGLGEEEEVEFSGRRFKNYNPHFMIAFLVLMACNYVALNGSTGWFLTYYHHSGYGITKLRSADPVQRAAGIEELVSVVNKPYWDRPEIREAVVKALSDTDETVRRWAVFGVGKLAIPESCEKIVDLFVDPEQQVRMEAAISVGKLNCTDGPALLTGLVQNPETLDQVRIGAVIGISYMIKEHPQLGDVVTAVLQTTPDAYTPYALWVVRKHSIKDAHNVVLKLLDDEKSEVKCGAADALKEVGIPEDIEAIKSRFEAESPKTVCEGLIYKDLMADRKIVVWNEHMRAKYMTIIANRSDPKTRDWFAVITGDESQPFEIRAHASDIVKMLDSL